MKCFHSEVLKKAYLQPFHDLVTDDARLLEQIGEKLFFVESEEENIKVTTENDLLIAKVILASKK